MDCRYYSPQEPAPAASPHACIDFEVADPVPLVAEEVVDTTTHLLLSWVDGPYPYYYYCAPLTCYAPDGLLEVPIEIAETRVLIVSALPTWDAS